MECMYQCMVERAVYVYNIVIIFHPHHHTSSTHYAPHNTQTDENMYQPVAPPPSSQTTTAPMSDNLPQPTPSVFANVTPPHTLEHSFSNSIAQHSDRDVSETERAQSTALPPHNFLTSSTAAHQASSQASGSSNTVVVPGDLARSFIEQHDDPQGLLLYDEARNRSLVGRIGGVCVHGDGGCGERGLGGLLVGRM